MYNLYSATACLKLLERLLSLDGVEGKNIVMVAMYQAQVKLLRKVLRTYSNMSPELIVQDIRAKTVDDYQGREADVVLVEMVATK